ncbi:MAG: dihydrofolate reductase family protein, partial [Thermoguttaceae bacterium]
GAAVLGSLFTARQIDEAHVFIAPKILGGAQAQGPFAGEGIERMADALCLDTPWIEPIAGDVYIHGRIKKQRIPTE